MVFISQIESAQNRPISTREWVSYLDLFTLPKDSGYWPNKRILDIGSGYKTTDPEFAFPGAYVCAIDPEFGRRITSHTAHEKKIAVAQNIPYPDNTFDLVLSSYGVPLHVAVPEIPETIAEILRIMTPDGEVRLTPCSKVFHISEELQRLLTDLGFALSFFDGPGNSITSFSLNKHIKSIPIQYIKEKIKNDALDLFRKRFLKPQRQKRFVFI